MTNFEFAMKRAKFQITKHKETLILAGIVGVVLFVIIPMLNG
ncbi:hypothetical protein ASswx1_51 [Aeromonas phage Asswx_1]|uniref:Uncharacterized protein n=1 Tax=Aeromonas phage Asswx_1 TaxID=2419739 RepID=A0A411B823_9CAUD|nr:hypothetical protein ASswx1_51 [Aeromonas phage Asswx_1]